MPSLSSLEEPVLIGVIHLPPLPGSNAYQMEPRLVDVASYVNSIIDYAVKESEKLVSAGFDAVIVENYGDAPYEARPHPIVVASLALVVRELARSLHAPVGVSLLRNDPINAIGVAAVSGAKFVRINALCTARISPEGVIGPSLGEASRGFSIVKASPDSIEILADVDVKHSIPLSTAYTPEWEILECKSRKGGLAITGIIISGGRTGEAPSLDYAKRLARIARSAGFKAFIGSGLTPENATAFRGFDGYIVGTSIKESPKAGARVVEARASAIVKALKGYKS